MSDTTTPTLRDEVLAVICDVNWERPYDAADAILALVREAMLSDAAVREAMKAAYVIQPAAMEWTEGEIRCMRRTLTAALDAVIGGTA